MAGGTGYGERIFAPGTEPSNGWEWVTGEDFSKFVHWGLGEPNNSPEEDFLHFRVDGFWNDIDAFNVLSAQGFIVEFESVAVPEPSSTAGLLFIALATVSVCLKRKPCNH